VSDTWNPSGTVLIKTDDGERASADDAPVLSEFDAFEALTSDLVRVPKSEIDKQRADG
jgi:hypothetical protein